MILVKPKERQKENFKNQKKKIGKGKRIGWKISERETRISKYKKKNKEKISHFSWVV